jgi:hypothetical protein
MSQTKRLFPSPTISESLRGCCSSLLRVCCSSPLPFFLASVVPLAASLLPACLPSFSLFYSVTCSAMVNPRRAASRAGAAGSSDPLSGGTGQPVPPSAAVGSNSGLAGPGVAGSPPPAPPISRTLAGRRRAPTSSPPANASPPVPRGAGKKKARIADSDDSDGAEGRDPAAHPFSPVVPPVRSSSVPPSSNLVRQVLEHPVFEQSVRDAFANPRVVESRGPTTRPSSTSVFGRNFPPRIPVPAAPVNLQASSRPAGLSHLLPLGPSFAPAVGAARSVVQNPSAPRIQQEAVARGKSHFHHLRASSRELPPFLS